MSRISRIKQRLMTRHSFIQIDHQQCRTFSRNLNFLDLINTNKTESKKLILIENIDSSSSSSRGNFSHLTKNVLSDNLKIKIDRIWNYTYRRRQFVLARLNQLNDIDQIQSRCDFHQHSLPVRSRMLETSLKIPNHIADDQSSTYNQRCFEYPNSPSMNNYQNFKHRQLNELKEKYPSNEFIGRLIEQNSLNELDIQLRYFIITQLEEILCGSVFRDFQIFPFGSSLVGLGDASSDLDLVLLHSNHKNDHRINFSAPEIKSERDQIQLCLSLIADIIRNFTPNFSQINRILRARIPIVKMTFDLAPIEIDVSIELSPETAHHGLIMANYLHYCQSVSPIIRELFYFLKQWSKQHSLVKNIAGNWLTNFQILCLAIYFLQTRKIIKPMAQVMKKEFSSSASSNESKELDEDKFQLFNLIYDFFEFIISFDFDKKAISLLEGKSFNKPDYSPLYIENPMEKDLNVCKNVSGVEFKKLLLHGYNSIDAMHCRDFHLIDLLDPEYFKLLEKNSKPNQKRN